MRGPRALRGFAILATICAAVWFAAPLAAQKINGPLPEDIGDLSNAQFMTIKDSAGGIVLRGRLIRQAPDGEEIERECELIGTGAFAKAEGEGEVEVTQVGEQLQQQVEVTVQGLPPNMTYTIFVDARQVGTLTTNVHGEAEVELETVLPPTPAAVAAPAAVKPQGAKP